MVDRAERVSVERLVQRGARGGGFGGWLVPVDTVTQEFGEEDPHSRVLRLVGSVYDVPLAPAWSQALALLKWVWKFRPDAEQVRRTLPRAYRLIAEDLTAHQNTWEACRADAAVYVASRRWVSINDTELFLDDLADDRLKGFVSGLTLATKHRSNERGFPSLADPGMMGRAS